MISRLLCLLPRRLGGGHLRGKFHSLIREQGSDKIIGRMIICPRCDTTWVKKVKAVA